MATIVIVGVFGVTLEDLLNSNQSTAYIQFCYSTPPYLCPLLDVLWMLICQLFNSTTRGALPVRNRMHGSRVYMQGSLACQTLMQLCT